MRNRSLLFTGLLIAGLFFSPSANADPGVSEPVGAQFQPGIAAAQAGSDIDSSVSADALKDTDQDGYSDEEELKNGYSPFNKQKVKLDKSDIDKDGLVDSWELKFKTDPYKADTDGDGYKDGEEVDHAYDPLSNSSKKLDQKIEIDLKKQKMYYLVAGSVWKEYAVSTGKPSMPTPKGDFSIINKSKKAWSNTYQLWMPYWMGLGTGQFGIHELPVWPDGYREGENHLGKPVSHGCIRLGIGPAQYLFERLDVGTKVSIK